MKDNLSIYDALKAATEQIRNSDFTPNYINGIPIEDYKLSLTLQLKIDHLDDRIKKFEVMLDEQVNELGAGKIAKVLRSSLKELPNSVILVSFEVLNRLMIYRFIEIDFVKGQNRFDKKNIVASHEMPNDTFILVPTDLKIEVA